MLSFFTYIPLLFGNGLIKEEFLYIENISAKKRWGSRIANINEASQFGQCLRGVLDPFSETLHIQSAFEII